MLMVIIGEILLYLCLSLLIGSFLIALVPSSYRPEVNIPRSVQVIATVGIGIFSFAPVLLLIVNLSESMGLSQTLQTVLLTFEIGKAWVFTFLVVNLLFIFIVWFDDRKSPIYSYIGIIFVVIIIMGLGWASHASSLDQFSGFFIHTSHFLAVSIWVGILLVVSWFSKDHSNWLKFLRWFSPVAVSCFSITIVSGLVLMTFVVEFNEYTNAWMLPYGQLLLLKHILIIPLLIYAGFNSILIKKKLLKNHDFNPLPWARVESILILVIFAITAALGQQSPPSDSTLKSEGPSKLFNFFYQGQFQQGMSVELVANATSLSLLLLAILLVALTVYSFLKKAPVIVTFILSILFVFSSYLALILSIQ